MLTPSELNLFKDLRFKQRFANFFNVPTQMVHKLVKQEQTGKKTLISSPLGKQWIKENEKFSESFYTPHILVEDSMLTDGTKSRLKRNWKKLSKVPYDQATIKDLGKVKEKKYYPCRYSFGIKTLSDIAEVCKECGVECQIQIKK